MGFIGFGKGKKNKTYIKTLIPSLRNFPKRTRRPNLFLLFLPLLIRAHKHESFFERNGERDEVVPWIVFVDPGFDLREPNPKKIKERKEVCSLEF